MTNWVTPETEIQAGTTQEPSKDGTPKIDYEARHKEASDTISKQAESQIKTNLKLATLDPKELLNMDTKMQNKIIPDLYGYNNLEELKLIQWEEFWKSKEENELSDTEELSKKIKILEYQNKKSDVNRALENYQSENKQIFSDDKGALEKLEAELAYISESLPVAERVQRAGRIVFGDNYVDKTTQAYLSMQDTSMSGGANAAASQGAKTKNSSFADFAKQGGFLKKD